jgi:hypothetical protein
MDVSKRFLIILLIIFFVSLAGVSASESPGEDASVNNESVSQGIDDVEMDNLASEANTLSSVADEDQSVDENGNEGGVAEEGQAKLGASNDEDVLGDGEQTLASEITSSSNINYRSWSTNFIPNSKGTTVKGSNYVINGNGYNLTGNNNLKLLTVDGGANNVTFMNIHFINGKGSGAYGGAIYINKGANVIFKNCIFYNNNASGSTGGGAICSNSSAKITIDNCTFNNNYAIKAGGAIYIIEGKVMLNITNSRFNNNSVKGGNDTGSFGGAIGCDAQSASESYLYLDNCNFTNHTVGRAHSIMQVKNLPNNSVKILNCRFEGNTAKTQSTVCIGTSNGLVVYNCTFKKNTVGGSDSNNAGAGLYISGCADVNVTKCKFMDNVVKGENNGGAICALGSTTFKPITNCVFC